MRIIFLGNNWVAWQALQWLRDRGEDVVGLVVHPPRRQKFGVEIIKAGQVDPARVFDAEELIQSRVVEQIEALKPDIGVSVFFGYIMRRRFLKIFPQGVVNLHPSMLPYNRGPYPNVWSIVEGTPSGVSLHYVDEGIDTGDIISQRAVPIEAFDTGETLYRRLESASLELFQETWPEIRAGRSPRHAQSQSEGTRHNTTDVERIDRIDLERVYRAGDLINVLRARTFPPHRGAYFEVGGKRVYIRVSLEQEDN